MTYKKTDAAIKFIFGVICIMVGFCLSFYKNRPFEVLPDSAVISEEGYRLFVPFQWSSIFVVSGCLLLVIGAFLLFCVIDDVLNIKKIMFTPLLQMEERYHSGLVALLVLLLFLTCEGTMESLAKVYWRFELPDTPMAEYMLQLKSMVLVFGVAVTIGMVLLLLLRKKGGRVFRTLANVFIVFGLLVMVLYTFNHKWYLVECVGVVLLYKIVMFCIHKWDAVQTEKVMEEIVASGVLEELDL